MDRSLDASWCRHSGGDQAQPGIGKRLKNAWAMDIDDEQLRHSMVKSIVYDWAQKDLEAATAWVKQIEDENLKAKVRPLIANWEVPLNLK